MPKYNDPHAINSVCDDNKLINLNRPTLARRGIRLGNGSFANPPTPLHLHHYRHHYHQITIYVRTSKRVTYFRNALIL